MTIAESIVTWHPLAAGHPPDWASGWGEDAYGPFVEIAIGSAVQRLRWIPPGEFLMGSPVDEPGRYEVESTPTLVTISEGFWLFDTPCTQEFWVAVMGENPSFFKSPTRPVEQVTWGDCVEFGYRLRDQIPGIMGQLPTEAEWEYACRAGTTTAKNDRPMEVLGDANAPGLDPIAWYAGNAGVDFELDNGLNVAWVTNKQYKYEKGGTHPVALKLSNNWGLYDMLGNVWEWCSDSWSELAESSIAEQSRGGKSAPPRVVRGGSWNDRVRDVRAACRSGIVPSHRNDYLGFRCRVQECEPSQPRRERADRSEQAAAPSDAEQ